MGLRMEVKKEMGYTEDNKTCSTCHYVVCKASKHNGGYIYTCHFVSQLTTLAVAAEASCNEHVTRNNG